MIEIREVKGKRMLKKFIDFPIALYKNCPYFTPYLYEDEIANLTPGKNPASSYCDFKLFMAFKDGKAVGRICAIISRFANERYNQKRIRFNRIDMIDDIEVTKALIGAVEKFGLENGMEEICGPLGYSDQDKEGLLTYGFDQKNMFATFYTYPYYVDHLRALGFVEDAVWIEEKLSVPNELDPTIVKIAEFAKKHYNLKLVRPKNKRQLKPYIKKVLRLTNECYEHLYEYVPINEEQMDHLAAQYVPLINLNFLQLIENEEGKLVAYGLMIPSPVDALKKCNGHLFPFGWIGFLHALNHSKVLDMLLISIHPDYRAKGAGAIIMEDACIQAKKYKIDHAETGPMLENNKDIQTFWNRFEKEHHKTRACFLKRI
ncbi:MAG: N-acetyltransferase [Clostridia bacterium]|nr:N-acetyltransferase [Clostridia bacterium]